MNEANTITRETKLYGFIAENAQSDRFAVTLNKRFKTAGDDAMMIPMNIRPDDFYFTLSNMKKSHVNGAVIAPEYQAEATELLDAASPLCEAVGICDTVLVNGGRLEGALLVPEALADMVRSLKAERIAILGASPVAEAMLRLLPEREIALFDPWIESLMRMQERVGRELDINRLAEGMEADLGGYDLLFDFSDMPTLAMAKALPKRNVDLTKPREASALRERCAELDAVYSGYESLLDRLTEKLYTYLTKDTV